MGWLEIICIWVVLVYLVLLIKNISTVRAYKKNNRLPRDYTPQQSISILIAARNEEQSILKCLEGIVKQEYPKELIEVLVLNDHSEDKTAEVAETFLKQSSIRYKIIFLNENESGKKTALVKGIEQSEGAIIVTRDADTYCYNPFWLKEIAFSFKTENCDLLILPVILSGPDNFTSSFQKYENQAINFLGAGMALNKLPIVCSGANLAYKKEAFLRLKPYENNLSIASGDDMFMLKAAYSKNFRISVQAGSKNPVFTKVESGLKQALAQRIRWASKTHKINTLPIYATALVLFSANLACLIALLSPFFNSSYLPFCLFTLTIKFIIDFLLLFLSARMFNLKVKLTWFLPAFVFNLMYTPVIALVSFAYKPQWKGRII